MTKTAWRSSAPEPTLDDSVVEKNRCQSCFGKVDAEGMVKPE